MLFFRMFFRPERPILSARAEGPGKRTKDTYWPYKGHSLGRFVEMNEPFRLNTTIGVCTRAFGPG
jgi:hypothetical protein